MTGYSGQSKYVISSRNTWCGGQLDLKLLLSFIFVRKVFSQGKYVSGFIFCLIELAQRFFDFCLF